MHGDGLCNDFAFIIRPTYIHTIGFHRHVANHVILFLIISVVPTCPHLTSIHHPIHKIVLIMPLNKEISGPCHLR